jgi:hypothetical protein
VTANISSPLISLHSPYYLSTTSPTPTPLPALSKPLEPLHRFMGSKSSQHDHSFSNKIRSRRPHLFLLIHYFQRVSRYALRIHIPLPRQVCTPYAMHTYMLQIFEIIQRLLLEPNSLLYMGFLNISERLKIEKKTKSEARHSLTRQIPPRSPAR